MLTHRLLGPGQWTDGPNSETLNV